MAFHDELKRIRLGQGLKQKDVAAKLGCSVQSYSQYESGKRRPKIETLVKIAEALNVEPKVLLWNEMQEDYSLPNDAINTVDYVTRNMGRFVVIMNKFEELEKTLERARIDSLIKKFSNLNDIGQKIALERIEELSKIPEYKFSEATISLEDKKESKSDIDTDCTE